MRISQEADAIDVVFDVTQREPIEAATVTNGSGVTSDDYVEVALSPNWSIHCGCGTGNYKFIWGMAGENQVFDDMDVVKPVDLR